MLVKIPKLHLTGNSNKIKTQINLYELMKLLYKCDGKSKLPPKESSLMEIQRHQP